MDGALIPNSSPSPTGAVWAAVGFRAFVGGFRAAVLSGSVLVPVVVFAFFALFLLPPDAFLAFLAAARRPTARRPKSSTSDAASSDASVRLSSCSSASSWLPSSFDAFSSSSSSACTSRFRLPRPAFREAGCEVGANAAGFLIVRPDLDRCWVEEPLSPAASAVPCCRVALLLLLLGTSMVEGRPGIEREAAGECLSVKAHTIQ